MQKQKIHGWLLFWLIIFLAFVCRNIQSIIKLSITYSHQSIDYLGLFYLVCPIILALFELYMVWSFFKFRPDAVLLGKSIFLITVVLNLISGFYDIKILDLLRLFLFTLIQAIWLFFLIGSEQVKQLFPKETRRVPVYDYFIVGAAVSIPVLIILVGIL
jgi:hypothetical protein